MHLKFSAKETFKVKTEPLKHYLQDYHAKFGLGNIGSIQRVKTVRSEHSGLEAFYTASSHIFNQISLSQQICVHLFDQNFEGLIFVTAAVVMEIEVGKFYLVFEDTLVHLPHIFGCDSYLSRSCVSEQVYHIYGPVIFNLSFEVYPKRLFSHLRIASQIYVFGKTALLPKYGHGASNLHMAEKEFVIYDQNLFGFAKVGHISLVIDSPRVVPCARSMVHSARNKRQFNRFSS